MKALWSSIFSLWALCCLPASGYGGGGVETFARFLPARSHAKIIGALRTIDFSEAGLARSAGILFVSAESTAVTGAEITNRIHFFQRGNLDIWIMRQRQAVAEGNNPETWSLVSIIVDQSTKPMTAYFLEFAPEQVNGLPEPIAPRVPCLRCHPNGPRSIRPARTATVPPLTERDLATLATFNDRIAKAGVIEGYSPTLPSGGELLNEQGPYATQSLPLPKCKQCHDPRTGIRNFLKRQNAGSILYLTTHGRDALGYATPVDKKRAAAMPLEDEALTAEETACLYSWLRRQPLPSACTDERQSEKVGVQMPGVAAGGPNSRTLTVESEKSGLYARVKTTLGSFLIENLKPSGAMRCDQFMHHCSGHFEVPLANASTGIAVRDRHFRKLLQVNNVVPGASLDIQPQIWSSLISDDGSSFNGLLSIVNKSRQVSLRAHCKPLPQNEWECSVQNMLCDIHRYGLAPPSFLGIGIDPIVEVSGTIILREE